MVAGMHGRAPTRRAQLDFAPGSAAGATAGATCAGGCVPRAVTATIICLLCYTVLEVSLGVWWMLPLGSLGPCQKDNEGSWSIGIFKGPSPLQLEPLERYEPRQDTAVAWPAANPVLTCASVGDSPSNFVADPFVLQRDGQLYMFYETKSTERRKGQIGVAVSSDGGRSFRHLAVVLDLPWHLSYPHVFEHGGRVYMLPEASQSGRLTLYRAADFPLVWEEERVLVPRPLVDASLVAWQGRWYLLGSDHSRRGAVKNGHLEVWHAASPLGPWQPHPSNPVGNGHRGLGFRMGGRIVQHGGRLYRFGQDCGDTYGRRLVAFEIKRLSPTEFEQVPVAHNISGLGGHSKPSWNSARHHHIDVQQLPSGEWFAAIDGDSVPSGQVSSRVLRAVARVAACWAMVAALRLCASVGMARSPAFRRWALSSGLMGGPGGGGCKPCGAGLPSSLLLHGPVVQRMRLGQLSRKKVSSLVELERQASTPLARQRGPVAVADATAMVSMLSAEGPQHGADCKQHPRQQPGMLSPTNSNALKLSAVLAAAEEGTPAKAAGLKSPRGSLLQCRLPHVPSGREGATSLPPLPGLMGRPKSASRAGGRAAARRSRSPLLRLAPGPVVLAHVAVAALLGCGLLCAYVSPFLRAARPLTVDGQHSQFTLLCMSYEARMSTLRHFVRHYSRCPSVSDIVLVWNDGSPPVPERDFDSAVPVRLRVEALNSLNNRFRTDPLIRNRAVLSLDDDIMMPCSDLERGFAAWRTQPRRLVGFFPRLVEGTPLVFRGERHSIERGLYNSVLTGAAFMDTETAFPAYWAPAVGPARDTVDRVFNGEDLLMNFVLANASRGAEWDAVEFVRPTRRLDISKLSGVGISHNWNGFKVAAQDYLAGFTSTFGGVPLQPHSFNWLRSPPFCAIRWLGCVYL